MFTMSGIAAAGAEEIGKRATLRLGGVLLQFAFRGGESEVLRRDFRSPQVGFAAKCAVALLATRRRVDGGFKCYLLAQAAAVEGFGRHKNACNSN